MFFTCSVRSLEISPLALRGVWACSTILCGFPVVSCPNSSVSTAFPASPSEEFGHASRFYAASPLSLAQTPLQFTGFPVRFRYFLGFLASSAPLAPNFPRQVLHFPVDSSGVWAYAFRNPAYFRQPCPNSSRYSSLPSVHLLFPHSSRKKITECTHSVIFISFARSSRHSRVFFSGSSRTIVRSFFRISPICRPGVNPFAIKSLPPIANSAIVRH